MQKAPINWEIGVLASMLDWCVLAMWQYGRMVRKLSLTVVHSTRMFSL
jgi:hypothetical protein